MKKLNRLLAGILVLLMAVSVCHLSGSAATSEFSDVRSTQYDPASATYRSIYWGVDNGIINGFSDGTFRPNDPCTRAQFAILIWKLSGCPDVNLPSQYPFSDIGDVTPNNQKAIIWAYNQEIINGYGGGIFGSHDSVTRAQVMIMLWKMAGKPEVSLAFSPFSDLSGITSNNQKAIIWGAETGLVNGCGNGKFGTFDLCTRAQIAIILYRYSMCVMDKDGNAELPPAEYGIGQESGDSADPGSVTGSEAGFGGATEPGTGTAVESGTGASVMPGSGTGSGGAAEPGAGVSVVPGAGTGSGGLAEPGAGAAVEPGAGANSAMNSGEGSAVDPGTGTTIDPGTESTAGSGLETPAGPGTDTLDDSGTKSGNDSAAGLSPEPSTEPKTEPGMNPAVEPGAGAAAEPSTEPETQPATEQSTEPETQPATESSTEPETEPATESSTEPETEPATEPETDPSMKPGIHLPDKETVDLISETVEKITRPEDEIIRPTQPDLPK